MSASRDRFQGKCLVNDEGWKYMGLFDQMPPEIRERLRTSEFNICTACTHGNGRNTDEMHIAIDRIEDQIRDEINNNNRSK